MNNDMTLTPADVRERVEEAWATVEAAALAQANVLDSHYGGQPAKAAEIRNAVEQVAALLRTPRGGRSALWWAANELVAALEGRSTLTVQQCITGVKRLLAEADLRTPRGEGAGVVAAASAYLRALDTYRKECRDREIPLAEYVYDEFRRLAEPLVEAEERLRAALRSEAQGEDRWEDLVFGPIVQAYNEAQPARRDGAQGEEV